MIQCFAAILLRSNRPTLIGGAATLLLASTGRILSLPLAQRPYAIACMYLEVACMLHAACNFNNQILIQAERFSVLLLSASTSTSAFAEFVASYKLSKRDFHLT